MNLLTSSVIVSVTATVIVNGNVTSGHPWRKRACPGRCFEAIVATPENIEEFLCGLYTMARKGKDHPPWQAHHPSQRLAQHLLPPVPRNDQDNIL